MELEEDAGEVRGLICYVFGIHVSSNFNFPSATCEHRFADLDFFC